MHFSYILAAGLAALTMADPAADFRGYPTDSKASPMRLTNIISVVQDPAKVEREEELLTTFIGLVKKNEPGVLEFQLNLDTNTSQFLTYEIYKNQEAINIHLNSSYIKHLMAEEQKESLKRGPNMVYFLDDLVTQFIR